MTRWTLEPLADLMRWTQDGVVSRAQIVEAGGTRHDIDRLLRRRELFVVHPCVYVDHAGRLSLAQRQWAAVLACWPAALAFDSALPDPSPDRVPHVVVDERRRIRSPARVVVSRTRHFDTWVDPVARPPRVRLEHATIQVMARELGAGDVTAAFAVLARVCQTRRTDPDRVAVALAQWPRVPGRTLLEALLADARDGSQSVLERGYRDRVERAHGLPRGRRQVRSTATGGVTFQDVAYPELGVVVELDGRAFHDGPRARDRDAMRDLAELSVGGRVTTRITFGMVFGGQCRTARLVADLLRSRGWVGRPRACPDCPDSPDCGV